MGVTNIKTRELLDITDLQTSCHTLNSVLLKTVARLDQSKKVAFFEITQKSRIGCYNAAFVTLLKKTKLRLKKVRGQKGHKMGQHIF